MKRTFSRSVLGLFFAVLIIVGFATGFFVGRETSGRARVPEGEGRVLGIGNFASPSFSEDVDFGLFWDVWNYIKDNYYRQPVSDKELFYGALRGLVAGAGDPYSTFFNPEDTEAFQEELNGSFEGVGMEIGIRDEQLQVIAPLPETPASRAGVLAGDKIFAIDGEDTSGMTVEDAVRKIRGPGGTAVTILFARDGRGEAFESTITRGTIRIKSVKWEVGEDNVARITIVFFNEEVFSLFEEAVQDILTKDVRGIVVDVRNNPGGLLDEVVRITGEWVAGRPAVIERVRGVDTPIRASGQARLAEMKTVVLVNGGSASASEIFAGALQDYGLATIVGEQTFGKGSVQDYQTLPDDSSVKLTVAEWLTPNGHSIHEVGITPDISVAFTAEDAAAGEDPQMEAAGEIILGTYANLAGRN
ncbi:S41 family peptidase [Candidatus Uhrbacteria bacterium]|nr:S41 family peptidase [Candidatus Uhrbacteria bacterium]